MERLYTPEDWAAIQLLFDQVVELPVKEQDAALARLCEKGSVRFIQVKNLLKSEIDAPEFLEQGALSFASSFTSTRNSKVQAKSQLEKDVVISANDIHYTILKELGAGGMGVVYLAEQKHPAFSRQVALKVLKNFDAPIEFKDRFNNEQKILASLNHPNIAQIYDSGSQAASNSNKDNNKENGQVFFAMEYIKGQRIDVFCDERHFDIRQRLQLIEQICSALSFAHQNLIVHRDIKPSNLLVNTEHQVKLVDFGIAKNLAWDDKTIAGEQLLTPQHAAPEQLNHARITPATDIYQLGLVIYKLLCGRDPFDTETISFAALINFITQQEPTPPSLRLQKHTKTACEQAKIIAANRNTTTNSLINTLKPELDAIVMRCLATKPKDRYASVESLARDIRAYMNGEPIAVMQNERLYLMKKQVRRHWRPLMVGIITLALGTYWGINERQHSKSLAASLERQRISESNALTTRSYLIDIFKAADPNVSGLSTITAQNLLESGKEKLDQASNLTPTSIAHLKGAIGEIYLSQGLITDSKKVLEEALELAIKHKLDYTPSLQTQLAIAESYQGNIDKAIALLNDSLTDFSRLPSLSIDEKIRQAEALATLGHLHFIKGEFISAENFLKQGLSIFEQLKSESMQNNPSIVREFYEEWATAINNLGLLNHARGEYIEAESRLTAAIDMQKQILGEKHSYYSIHLNNLATLLTDMERYSESYIYATRAKEIQIELLGDKHPYLRQSYRILGVTDFYRGYYPQAISWLELSLFNIEGQDISPHREAQSRMWLGVSYQAIGNYSAAASEFENSIEQYKKITNNGEILGRVMGLQGELAMEEGKYEKAETVLLSAVENMEATSLRSSYAHVALATLYALQNNAAEAKHQLKIAQKLRKGRFPANHSLALELEYLQAVLAQDKGRKESIATQLRESQRKPTGARKIMLERL
ncbi:Serine/threonine-protein kinase PrkC [Thalassocella blandensis]|nr:Serine/threonine-protein kinase PrkC [Thalassocella blandensis]